MSSLCRVYELDYNIRYSHRFDGSRSFDFERVQINVQDSMSVLLRYACSVFTVWFRSLSVLLFLYLFTTSHKTVFLNSLQHRTPAAPGSIHSLPRPGPGQILGYEVTSCQRK
eukprot:sb/3477100/